MKKVLSVIMAFGILGFISGCTPTQQAAVAKQLGIAAAVTWVGIDNPSLEDMATVKSIVEIIGQASCTNCTENSSYYARVYPIVDDYISVKVKENQQPMARLGAAFILTSLDTGFAMNPTWGQNATLAASIVESFCSGAELGLGMAPSSSVMVAAKRQGAVRAVAGKTHK